MSLRDDIKALYRAKPELSGEQVLEHLGKEKTPSNWRILSEVQVQMRGNRPAIRKGRNKGPLNSWRGATLHGKPIEPTRFIPPEQK